MTGLELIQLKSYYSIAPEILKWQSVFLYNLGRLNDFIGPHNSFPLNYFAQILCCKNQESIDIIVILHFYEKSTSRWYEGLSQL